MENQIPQESIQSDEQRVKLVQQVIADVTIGRITKATQIRKALVALGSHYGPFGCSSAMLETAIADLRYERHKKGI